MHDLVKSPFTMSARSFIVGIVLTIAAACCSNSTQAQVYIPDLVVRNWLNYHIPGIVDSGGVMDTLHPAIATLSTPVFGFDINDDQAVDLTGMQYLDSLNALSVNIGPMGAPSEIIWAFPPP